MRCWPGSPPDSAAPRPRPRCAWASRPTELPIWIAALGHHTTRVAAELGDGWIPALVARDRLPSWAAQLRQLRDAAAPHAQPLTVAAGPITAATENADAARDIAEACTAWYLGAMGDVYARSVSGQGYAAEVQAIIAANPRPSPRGGTIPPSAQVVLDQLAAYGTRDQVREQLKPWDHAADIVTILLPPGMSWPDIEATLLAAAPIAQPATPRSPGPLQSARPSPGRPSILFGSATRRTTPSTQRSAPSSPSRPYTLSRRAEKSGAVALLLAETSRVWHLV